MGRGELSVVRIFGSSLTPGSALTRMCDDANPGAWRLVGRCLWSLETVCWLLAMVMASILVRLRDNPRTDLWYAAESQRLRSKV